GQLRGLVIGVEQDLPLEQGAQDRQQAVADATQGTPMAVSALAQRRVLPAAGGIMLNGDPCPVIDGFLQALVAGMSPDDDAALAAAAGDRGDAGQHPQGVVVSSPQRLCDLGEQRGDVDPSEPWTGTQDRNVALLAALPRRGLDGGAELVQPPLSLFDLRIDE